MKFLWWWVKIILVRFTAKNTWKKISLNHAPSFCRLFSWLCAVTWMFERSLQVLKVVPENFKLRIHYFKPIVFTLTGRRKTCDVQKPTAWQIIHNNVFTVEELTAIYWFWANYSYLYALPLYKKMLLKRSYLKSP